jgi:arylsulfatase A-like enzyme
MKERGYVIMNRREFVKQVGFGAVAVSLPGLSAGGLFAQERRRRPNVLFVICDDLNHYVEGMGGHRQAKTPNIKRLMKMGVTFTNAHTNHPACLPSRSSLFRGLYPHVSGAQGWEGWKDSKILEESKSMFAHLRDNGYAMYGTGKLNHSSWTERWVWDDEEGKSNFAGNTDYGPSPWNGKDKGWGTHPKYLDMEKLIINHQEKLWKARGEHSFGPLSDVPEYKPDPKNGIPGYKGWAWANRKPFKYVNDDDRDLMSDEKSANFAADVLSQEHDKPFFLGVGFIRPHTPMYAPKKYFDMFPLDKIKLPPYKEDDLEDCMEFKHLVFKYGFQRHELYNKFGGVQMWKKCIQAYLACTTFADAQIGKVLDALEKSSHAKDTIVIFTSDHGFHLGEKDFNFKLSGWELSTRVPFVVVAPGITKGGTICRKPISLIDIYPTIADLCGLGKEPNAKTNKQPLSGHSIKPFLRDPKNGKWGGPDVALTCIYDKDGREGQTYHFSVKSEEFRYTLYSNDAEELYDHRDDPHEWENLAGEQRYKQVKSKMKRKLFELLGGNPDEKRGIAYK